MQAVSYIVASCDSEFLPQMLKELNDEFTVSQLQASQLEKWFSENVDLSSTIVLSVGVSNLGKRPILVSATGRICVPLQGKEPIVLECICETCTDDTQKEKATTRIVRILSLISQLLDVPVRIRRNVPSVRVLVQDSEATTLTFRTEHSFGDDPAGGELLNLYRSGQLSAHLELTYQTLSTEKTVRSKPFEFGTTIPSVSSAGYGRSADGLRDRPHVVHTLDSTELSCCTDRTMHVPGPHGKDENGYAFGSVVGKNGDGTSRHWHNGSGGTFYAPLFIYPDADLFVAMATNVGIPASEALSAMGDAIHKLYAPK